MKVRLREKERYCKIRSWIPRFADETWVKLKARGSLLI